MFDQEGGIALLWHEEIFRHFVQDPKSFILRNILRNVNVRTLQLRSEAYQVASLSLSSGNNRNAFL